MSLLENNGNGGFYMPVAPAYGGGGFGGGYGGFGGDGWWILLLILLAGGWNNNGLGGGFGGGNDLYPWLNNSQNINGGFRDQMLGTQINGIQNAITTGFGDVQNSLCNGFNQTQMGILQSANGLQAQLAQCCCDNRMATQDLKYTIATEESTTRAANAANTQSILDKLCQLELDGYKRENDALRSQLSQANLAASQIAQTSAITDGIYNRLATCPVGTVPVFGEQPIFRCNNNNNGCGCGCNG